MLIIVLFLFIRNSDMSSLYNWNVKELFLYIVAEYATDDNVNLLLNALLLLLFCILLSLGVESNCLMGPYNGETQRGWFSSGNKCQTGIRLLR